MSWHCGSVAAAEPTRFEMRCKRCAKCAQIQGQTSGGTWERPRAWVGSRTSCSVPRCPHISIMTSMLTVLLVVLVGLPVAQALECHVCAYNGDNCFKPMRCPAMATYCMTTRTYFTPYRMKVRKSCVPSCFETVYDGYSKHASATSCCQYYLCNGAGFPTPVTLALVPVLLATFWSLL
ncbi:Ly-6/neurotoxin-like protein 1 [Microtus ochrogaster]|uniref:Ly-6/neurotoxin-like protein 1 n=1 Tax=Microtus ochrogaster TaxID=79684 RepID=A0A8J6GXK1_MICOH|nr:Ly-6/neurotoxin-like protein 1 [Microtus ochrogaster]